jgi:hypothetical protein
VKDVGDAFVTACEHGELAMTNLLIKINILHASDKTVQAFTAAVSNGHIAVVQTLFDKGHAADT